MSEADLFIIPHYSRMCSGLDGDIRWNMLQEFLQNEGRFFNRYSGADHFLMHSAPNYGDRPADQVLTRNKSVIVGMIDLKYSSIRDRPWIMARFLIVPFITLPSDDTFRKERNISVYVAMSTSTRGLRAPSGVLRETIE
jgi:hypothetical protein